MLTLTGTIRAAQTLPGFTNRKTGEVSSPRSVVQLEGFDNRGLVQLYTLTVPDLAEYSGREGESITVPVRAWAPGAVVSLSYEAPR
jgi:hypothetical protein